MYLTNLRLQHFRNHLESCFDLGRGTNVFLGDNGQGKTNVIEAISYLCLTKSFHAGNDSLVVNFGNDVFEIEGIFVSDAGIEKHVRVAYSESQAEKVVTISRQRVEKFSSMIGNFPIVICSPEYEPITSEGPDKRRKFVDFIISQSNAQYFQRLLAYRKVLRHRNKILFDGKMSRKDLSDMLEPWDEQLGSLGGVLLCKRREFIGEFQEFVCSSYHHLVGQEEEPTIEYQPNPLIQQVSTPAEIEGMLIARLREKRDDEMRLGITLVGPHRDDFLFKINARDLRKYASQGQHKTFLIALKIAEFFYLKDRCNERPIVLLDDVFSELDEHRARDLLSFVGELSQVFITSTDPEFFENAVVFGDRNRRFFIQNGAVVEQRQVPIT